MLAQVTQESARRLRTESRAGYVHRLTLYDADGKAISPTDENPRPYSSRVTCGKCHEYGRISHGWHFNAQQTDVAPGRPGESWILALPEVGLQLPLSNRGWAGTFAPGGCGVDERQMLRSFGRHMPGGSYGEPDPAAIANSDVASRWALSGVREIDCMLCHSADLAHDPAEAARQVAVENLQWAATAALGIAVVRGEVKSLPDDFDPLAPATGDRSLPRVQYDRARFDGDDRVFFDITRRPPPERCYFCHTQRLVSPTGAPRWRIAGDVHLAAGMACTDCHRNGIDHDIIRGYPGEEQIRGNPDVAAFSCAGCHLGESSMQADRVVPQEVVSGGLHAAPQPQHRGIPTLHFEKLTCTACHSGPTPQARSVNVQTSMAHALGIASKERTDADPPSIVEPMFARDSGGRIAPFRMLWPAYWARRRGDWLEPIGLEQVQAAGKQAVKRGKAKQGAFGPLTDEEISAFLAALGNAGGAALYIRDGRIYSLADGKLNSAPSAAHSAYRWPLAHDVRPAAQALGARGCTDCHAGDAPIYFGSTSSAAGPPTPPGAQVMYELHESDPALARAWAIPMAYRGAFAALAWTSIGALAVLLLGYAGAAIRGVSRACAGDEPNG